MRGVIWVHRLPSGSGRMKVESVPRRKHRRLALWLAALGSGIGLRVGAPDPAIGKMFTLPSAFFLFYQLAEGAGDFPVKIEPAEASRGECRFDCGIDPPSMRTAHREGPYRHITWGHERSCRKVRTSQSRSRDHPRRLRESRSSPTTSSSECTLDEHIFRDPPP